MYANAYKRFRPIKARNIVKKTIDCDLKHVNTHYFYYNGKSKNLITATKYIYRLELFIRICKFFKGLALNYNMLLKVFYTKFYTLWLIFVHSGNRNIYYIILMGTVKFYRKLFLNKILIRTTTYIVRPNHFLIDLPLSATGRNKFNTLSLKQFNNKWKAGSYRHKKVIDNLTICDFGENYFTVHFIRTQRRYNKRRYSRVRAFSRPPFFAGISLSSMFIGSFWNGSIKNVDWLTAWPVVIDVNVVLFILLCYVLFRLFRVYYISIFVRKRGKIKIINALNKMFFASITRKIFKK